MQVQGGELRHVFDGRDDLGGGGHGAGVVVGVDAATAVGHLDHVRRCHLGPLLFRREDRARGHPERVEDVLLDVRRRTSSPETSGHDLTQQSHSEIRVLVGGVRWEDRRLAGDRCLELVAGREVVRRPVGEGAFPRQARGVGQKIPDGDRRSVGKVARSENHGR